MLIRVGSALGSAGRCVTDEVVSELWCQRVGERLALRELPSLSHRAATRCS